MKENSHAAENSDGGRYSKNNYEITKDRIRPEFLKYDQEEMIRKFHLAHDSEYLYLEFAGAGYRIRRNSGEVERMGKIDLSDSGQIGLRMRKMMDVRKKAEREADYLEALSIYDILCCSSDEVTLQGQWCLVNSLPGVGQNSGLGDTMYEKDARYFDGNPEMFAKACRQLGGKEVGCGDIGFEIPVFPFFRLRLRFYRSDEEFPASLSVFFDVNTLRYMHYETTYYVVSVLMREIRGRMEEKEKTRDGEDTGEAGR